MMTIQRPEDDQGRAALMWWGYRHVNGDLLVKRLLDDRDLDEARESPFVAQVYGPFPASHRAEALSYLRRMTGEA